MVRLKNDFSQYTDVDYDPDHSALRFHVCSLLRHTLNTQSSAKVALLLFLLRGHIP